MTRYLYCPECRRPLARKKHPDGQTLPTCPTGHFTKYNNMAATAGAFIRKGGKYLALRRAISPYKGSWDLPGGFCGPMETPEKTVVREMAEEIGLRVKPLRVIGMFPSRYGQTGTTTLNIVYECSVASGQLKLDHENSQAAWFSLKDYPRLPFSGDQAALTELRKQKGQRG